MNKKLEWGLGAVMLAIIAGAWLIPTGTKQIEKPIVYEYTPPVATGEEDPVPPMDVADRIEEEVQKAGVIHRKKVEKNEASNPLNFNPFDIITKLICPTEWFKNGK